MCDDNRQCTNCKVWRNYEKFIGKKGDIVKRCIKCREKDARQKQRPDVMEKRNKRGRERKYYEKYRKRKREEDNEGFIAHNTHHQRTSVSYRICALKHSAKKRSISLELTDERLEALMSNECFFCSSLCVHETLNGVDRLDSSVGYTFENSVPCCSVCNYMKKCLDPLTFVKRCIQISSLGVNFDTIWKNYKGTPFGMYKKRAETLNIDFTLSKDDFDCLRTKNCHYCRRPCVKDVHINGIDRLDNSIGYVIENCVSCCGDCNYAKEARTLYEFLDQCRKVSRIDIDKIPENIETNIYMMKRN